VRSAAFQSFVCDRDAGLLDSPLPCPLAVSGGKLRCLSSIAVPTYFRKWFILSYASLLYKVLLLLGPPKARELSAPSLGFAVPLRDISHPRPCSELSERSSPCRPRRFSRPRRFPPRLALEVYFTLQPRPGFTLQGFDTSFAAASPFDDRCPLVVVPTLLMSSCPLISTPSVLALRAFIRVRVRDPMVGV